MIESFLCEISIRIVFQGLFVPVCLVFQGCSVPFFRHARALHVLTLRASDTIIGTLRLGVCRRPKISFIRPHKGTVKSRGVGATKRWRRRSGCSRSRLKDEAVAETKALQAAFEESVQELSTRTYTGGIFLLRKIETVTDTVVLKR